MRAIFSYPHVAETLLNIEEERNIFGKNKEQYYRVIQGSKTEQYQRAVFSDMEKDSQLFALLLYMITTLAKVSPVSY